METTVKERLIEFLEKEGIPKTTFSAQISDSKSYVNSISQSIQPDKLLRISQLYPRLNLEWLMVGKGEMIRKEETGITDDMVSTTEGVPFYNVDFELGFDLMVNDQTAVPEYLINFAPYNKCTAWCTASGNSMLPTISGGDMIALKKIEDFTYLISGEIYALITRNGLRTVKRVKDNGDSFTLIPDNKDYYEQTIPKEEFTHVFQVMGAMKRF